MLIVFVLFIVVFAVFYLFGSPKPASAAAAALVTAGQRAMKLFLVMFLISAGTIAALIAHKHSTQSDAREKASTSSKWDQYEVKPAPRAYEKYLTPQTPARRATP